MRSIEHECAHTRARPIISHAARFNILSCATLTHSGVQKKYTRNYSRPNFMLASILRVFGVFSCIRRLSEMSAFSNVEFLTLKTKKRFPSLCELRGFSLAKKTCYLKNRIFKRYLGGQRQFCFWHLLIVSYFLVSLALIKSLLSKKLVD